MQRIFSGFLIGVAACLLSSSAWALVPLRVVVYGDSLLSGYELQPEETYAAKLDHKLKAMGYQSVQVTNITSPDATTTDAASKLSTVRALHPDIVVVAFGVNDAQRGINIPLMSNNLGNMLSTLNEDRTFIVMMGFKNVPGIGYVYAQQLDEMFVRIATQQRVHFYPDALLGISGNPDLTLADGFHPNGKGMDAMVEYTYRMVDEGLRYKWSVQQFQEYQQQLMNSSTGTGAQPATPISPN